MNPFTRRAMIQQGAALSAGLALSSRNRLYAQDAAAEPHFFVFTQMVGAWDVCLAFDPKDRDSRLSDGTVAFDQPYAMNEVKTYGGIPLAPAGQVLSSFCDRMAVINGIDMEVDNGHNPTRMMTGFPSGGASPSIQALVSAHQPFVARCLLPHLYTSFDGFFSGGQIAGQTIVADRLGIYRILASSQSTEVLRWAAQAGSRVAQSYGHLAKRKLLQHASTQQNAADLKDHLASISIPQPDTPEDFGKFCGALFAEKLCGSITWSFDQLLFDTHSDHYNSHPLGKALEEIQKFATSLGNIELDANTSVLDRTTFVLCSEFCRTPQLNSFAGKDHNFRTNSVVMFGHQVKPGFYGQSGERREPNGNIFAHSALPMDYKTGSARPDGEILLARNLWAGAGSVFGFKLTDKFGINTKSVQFL